MLQSGQAYETTWWNDCNIVFVIRFACRGKNCEACRVSVIDMSDLTIKDAVLDHYILNHEFKRYFRKV